MDPSVFLNTPSATDIAGDLGTVGGTPDRGIDYVTSTSERAATDIRLARFPVRRIAASGPARGLFGDRRTTRSPVATDDPLGGQMKRVFDVTVTAIGCACLLPVLALLIVLLKLGSRGPVFYAQTRIGFGGRPFPCYKFRTMVEDGDAVLAEHLRRNPEAALEWAESRKLRRDPRITAVGRILRLTSLDELPQLLNVLRGEMSLVGPRPIVGEELARYSIFQNSYLRTRPGLTGLWQVSGRSNVSYERRVELDRSYVLTWSLWTDLRILARTIPAVMRVGDSA